jgi:hypothetical protein
MKKALKLIGAMVLLALIYANVKAFELPGGDQCVKVVGEQMYGTSCWVKSIDTAPIIYYTFNTYYCQEDCTQSGTQCCYRLEARY